MKLAGQVVLHASVEQVWDAVLDPAVLVRTIPGCERLEAVGEHEYAMTVTAGVGSIRGTYTGKCALSDLVPRRSLLMKAEGAGGPGTVAADVAVSFGDLGDGTTEIGYTAEAVVGGTVGGVGQRMLTSVSRRMAGEFFAAVEDAILTGGPAAASESTGAESGTSAAPEAGEVFTAPPRHATAAPGGEFLRGVATGGVLVLAGVLVGGLVGRRRR